MVLFLSACSDGGAANLPPDLLDPSVTTTEDQAVSFTLPATDPRGEALTFTTSTPAHGTVTGTAPDLVYTPAADFAGEDQFTVTVSDGASEVTATVTVTVTPVNDAPIATDDMVVTNEDTSLDVAASSLTANDVDVDGPSLAITSVDEAVHGSVSLVGQAVTFVPDANYNGAASFGYTVTDGTLTSHATVHVTVGAVDGAPVATDDVADTDEDTALVLAEATLLANDTDEDGQTLSVASVGDAVHGTVMLSSGTITFQPEADYAGPASFTYTVTDGALADVGTVTVTVHATNDAPVAVDDVATTDEDTSVDLSSATLLANDVDVDGPSLSVVSVGDAQGGTVSLVGDTVTFTPTADFAGSASFSYTVTDGSAQDVGVVTLTVAAVNDPPVAVDDLAQTDEDQALVFAAASLVANDTDIDGPSLAVTSVGNAFHGTVSLVGGQVTFTPEANFFGSAAFEYTVSDGQDSDVGAVSVTVTSVNDLPVVGSQSVTTRKNIPVSITLAGTDVENSPLTFTVASGPAHGSVSISGATAIYTPATNYLGSDSFTFVANDGANDSSPGQIDLTIAEPVCGNSVTEPGEACDDGNRTAGDGCRADCRGVESCGDGLVDSVKGEMCDDGNGANGDGCSNGCALDAFSNVSSTVISGSLSCNTTGSNTGRKAAVSSLGRFFVAMNCGGTGYVSVSSDRGATWPGPVSTGITGVQAIAVEGGPDPLAYVVAKTTSNTIVFTRTTDGGVTWETPRTLAMGVTDAEVSIDSFGDSVYVVVATSSTNLRLLANYARGQGTFSVTDVAQANIFHDVIVDKVSGDVITGSDNPAFRIRRSSDQGLTFGAEATPPGQAFFSDWAGSNGYIYVSGTNGDNNIDRIPMSSPGTSTQVSGLPSNVGAASVRAIDADAVGNAYVVSQLTSGNVQLDRMVFGASSILASDARTIASGTAPAVAALPSNTGALVAYTSGTVVYGAVVVYP